MPGKHFAIATMEAPDFTKQSLIPHLCVVGGLDAIAYYQKAFGAKILGEPFLADDKKRVMHAAIDVRDDLVMLCCLLPLTIINQ